MYKTKERKVKSSNRCRSEKVHHFAFFLLSLKALLAHFLRKFREIILSLSFSPINSNHSHYPQCNKVRVLVGFCSSQ